MTKRSALIVFSHYGVITRRKTTTPTTPTPTTTPTTTTPTTTTPTTTIMVEYVKLPSLLVEYVKQQYKDRSTRLLDWAAMTHDERCHIFGGMNVDESWA